LVDDDIQFFRRDKPVQDEDNHRQRRGKLTMAKLTFEQSWRAETRQDRLQTDLCRPSKWFLHSPAFLLTVMDAIMAAFSKESAVLNLCETQTISPLRQS
jgi:hypothetical protein